jgi:hypothetical protein
MKLIKDTLKVNDRWAHKRVLSFVSFHVGAIYAFIPIVYPSFQVQEFVVMCFFGLSAGCLGIDLQQKIKVQDEGGFIGTQINNNNETIG